MNNKILLFWNIGKRVYEEQNTCDNPIQKYSEYCSYYFGNSVLFTRENIHLMKRFYMNFPIYYKEMDSINWEQYQLLLMIKNKKERFFYYALSLFLSINYFELLELIQNNYYLVICNY